MTEKVLALDDTRATPGPLVGPVLTARFGYLPERLHIVTGIHAIMVILLPMHGLVAVMAPVAACTMIPGELS